MLDIPPSLPPRTDFDSTRVTSCSHEATMANGLELLECVACLSGHLKTHIDGHICLLQ